MRTCNELHCHNQELHSIQGQPPISIKSNVQPQEIETCWVSYGGTCSQLLASVVITEYANNQLLYCLPQ